MPLRFSSVSDNHDFWASFMTATGIMMTADELLRLPRGRKRYELINGELHEGPLTGGQHGYLVGQISFRLRLFLEQHPEGAGFLLVGTGFWLARDPDTVRAPDVAYVAEPRLSQARVPGYPELAPDLIVEVVSPGDRASEVQAKIDEWLRAGVQLAWVLYPVTHSAMAFYADGATRLLHADNTLTGEPVLSGFTCRLSELF
jgi:Uma2 family endonuclease